MSKKQLKLEVPPMLDAEKIAREHIEPELFEQVLASFIFLKYFVLSCLLTKYILSK